jgi:hypothetical protein
MASNRRCAQGKKETEMEVEFTCAPGEIPHDIKRQPVSPQLPESMRPVH